MRFNRREIHREVHMACFVRLLSVLFLLISACPSAHAQAVTCSSMGLDPVVPEAGNPAGIGILDIYYLESGSGLGCYVHPHRNGKDFVITPPGWGANPNPEHQGWIDLAMKGISESRATLMTIGSLDTNLYVLVTDRSAADVGRPGGAEAYWLLGDDCWAEMRADVQADPAGPASGPESFKFVLAHEIGHCFLMENIPNYELQTEWEYTVDWWDESGAEFLAAQVYPTLNLEFSQAGAFDLDQIRWPQAYRAVVLLQHYANTTNNQKVIALLEWFHEIGKVTPTDGAEALYAFFDAIYEDPHFGEFYHDFVVTHYQSQVQDPGGGTMPREAYVDTLWSQALAGESGTVAIPPAPANRLVLGELTIPAGYEVQLTPPGGSGKRHYQTLLENGRFIKDWTESATFAGNCEYETQAWVLLTHHAEIELKGLEMSYRLEELGSCGEPEIEEDCMKPRTSDLQPDHDHRPYYEGPDPIRAKAACLMACQDACWCRNKHMWSFEPVTKDECDAYYPNGDISIAPGVPTKCQGMTHPDRRRPAPPKKDVLDVHCGTLCADQC